MLFSSVDGENDAIWKRWRYQNRHDQGPDHLTVSIQDAGQTLPVASISRQFCGPIYWNEHACVQFIWAWALSVLKKKRFQNGYGVVVWTGKNDTIMISVDTNLFENKAKKLHFRLKTD